MLACQWSKRPHTPLRFTWQGKPTPYQGMWIAGKGFVCYTRIAFEIQYIV
jgi:hypothetical protein